MDQSKLIHFSDTPWSNYTAADYTIEQWHKACLIHQHVGPPTAKNQCKLPIRTPDGAVNVNGIFAAAAVLDGARGGVAATPDEKATAAKELIKNYKILNKKPPPGLLRIAGVVIAQSDTLDKVLAHYGIKGMHWGTRKPESASIKVKKPGKLLKTTGGKGQSASEDATKAALLKRTAKKSSVDALSNAELKALVNRMNMEQQYFNLAPKSRTRLGHAFATKLLAESGKEQAKNKMTENSKKVGSAFKTAFKTTAVVATL